MPEYHLSIFFSIINAFIASSDSWSDISFAFWTAAAIVLIESGISSIVLDSSITEVDWVSVLDETDSIARDPSQKQ